jgi:hypothetical protein
MADRGDAEVLEVVGCEIGNNLALTSFFWNGAAYLSRPRFRNQSVTFIGALWQAGRMVKHGAVNPACPGLRSLNIRSGSNDV